MKALPLFFGAVVLVVMAVRALAPPDFGMKSLPLSDIAYPDGEPGGVVVLLSDADGWSRQEEAASDALAQNGAVVVGVDLPDYYAALSAEDVSDTGCLYLVSDIEELSRQIHREQEIASYHQPVVTGIGAGGALALAIAAQTPPSTIAQTLAVDPLASIPLSKILCTPAGKLPVDGGMRYGLTQGDLPNPVRVVFSAGADAAGRAHVDGLKTSHEGIDIENTAQAGIEALRAATGSALDSLRQKTSPLDLPLVPVDTVATRNTLAIVYSGDGGWRDIDQKLAAYLSSDGIPVVGVDALRYFWTEKTPQQTANDLSRIIATYRKRWNVEHVVLIGYSFGANILPATYRLLPQADRDTVRLVSMLALSHQADFEIAVTGWLGYSGMGKYGDPADDLALMEPHKIQCIYGLAEDDTACPAVAAYSGADIRARPGGHHFDGDYRALNRLIVDRLDALNAAEIQPSF